MTAHHPLRNIAEWRKGCTCAPKDSPAECIDCTVGLITAVENWFNERVESTGATIELPSQPVKHLSQRLQKAMWDDGFILPRGGFDAKTGGLHQPLGAALTALIVEVAGHEAEAYALQDQVEEANSSVTALEQRVAEADKVLKELRAGVEHSGWVVGVDVYTQAVAWLANE